MPYFGGASMAATNRLFNPLRKLGERMWNDCRQTDPQRAALSVAFGTVAGLIPAIGVATPLSILIGVVLRLNHIIVQGVQWLLWPLQLILIPVFISAGKWLFLPHISSAPVYIREAASQGFFQALRSSGELLLSGIALWLIASILLGPLIYFLVFQILSRADKSVNR